jgi:hypothetical protein
VKIREAARKARLQAHRQAHPPTLTLIQKAAPTLPGYLQETCYLSHDPCDTWPPHRYRQTGLTLRYKADDQCLQCVTSRALDRLEQRRA